jgi:hypothetical protein
VALLLGVLAGVAGCSTPQKEIDVIGVVASEGGAYDGPDMVDKYTFDDGRTYSMRYHGHARAVEGPGVLPNVGDLLIAGTHPGNWMLVANLRDDWGGWPKGCYGLGSQAGYDTATTVELDFGVTLQKAPDFNPTDHGQPGRFGSMGAICLDRQGRVTQIEAVEAGY